nr:ph and sec7 domain-containing protein c11e3.11c [Quercus suber]
MDPVSQSARCMRVPGAWRPTVVGKRGIMCFTLPLERDSVPHPSKIGAARYLPRLCKTGRGRRDDFPMTSDHSVSCQIDVVWILISPNDDDKYPGRRPAMNSIRDARTLVGVIGTVVPAPSIAGSPVSPGFLLSEPEDPRRSACGHPEPPPSNSPRSTNLFGKDTLANADHLDHPRSPDHRQYSMESTPGSFAPDRHRSTSPSTAARVTLSKRTSSRKTLNAAYTLDASPPSTPPRNHARPSSRGKQPMRGPSSAQAVSTDTRHSHGLSWSSTTRDSVVDTLLLSLDNLSSAQGPRGPAPIDDDDDDDDTFDRARFRIPAIPQLIDFNPSNRPRGHTYSSSLSSEYYPSRPYQGQASPPQSLYETPKKVRQSVAGTTLGSSGDRRGQPPLRREASTETQKHARELSSDVSIEEFPQYQAESRSAHVGRRSMSMDHIYSAEGMSGVSSVLGRGRPVVSINPELQANMDAAPEPVVAAGPRRLQNPNAVGPVYVNPAPKQSSLRKITTQGDLRSASKQNLAQNVPVGQDYKAQASDFIKNGHLRGGSPAQQQRPQISPMISPGLSSTHQKDAPSVRDRPGFFRRVFGGGNSRVVSGASDRSGDSFDIQDKGTAAPLRAKSQASTTATRENVPLKSSAGNAPPSPAPPPAMLNKKPSSFFRRRKKSTSENLAPPPLPLDSQAGNLPRAAQPSPSISSLRKVMDPFLSTEGETLKGGDVISRPTTGSRTVGSDDLDIFHSGYTPPADSSLAALRIPQASRTAGNDGVSGSPHSKLKVKKRTVPTLADVTKGNISPVGDEFSDTGKVSPLTAEIPYEESSELRRPVSPLDNSRLAPTAMPRTGSGEDMRNFSAGTNIDLNWNDDDEGWVVKRTQQLPIAETPEVKKPERVILKPMEQEEKHRQASLASSISVSQGMASPVSSLNATVMRENSTHNFSLPSVQIDGNAIRQSTDVIGLPLTSSSLDDGAEYAERARRIFDGDEEDVSKGEAAAWLGERNTLSTRTLQAYMQLFDLSGLNLVASLRTLAGKLLLKGETQQFDRIITALSSRWCECNPKHGFQAQDVVHTIIYSLVLLNTDLHLADIPEKMSKAAYVKNTLPTIRRVVTDAAPDAFDDTIKPGGLQPRPSVPWTESAGSPSPSSPTFFPECSVDGEDKKPTASKRLSLRPGMMRQESDSLTSDAANQSNALVSNPWTGTMKGWEGEIEAILKCFWASIRNEPLPLMSVSAELKSVAEKNLSVTNMIGSLKRSGSVVSKAPSDNLSQYRSKPGLRNLTMNWQQRNGRARPNAYAASTLGSSSRTSFDDNNSMWSPPQSSSWSRNSYAKTLTSASLGSFQHFSPATADFKHSIGFANALSQAIIREEGVGNSDTDSLAMQTALLDDESLTLQGAPWAKEGLVKHKHHLETADRKAKERNWNDCFAVISKGKLTLFAFGTATSKAHSMGRKNIHKAANSGRAASIAGTKVGGGDWMESAEQLEVFVLRQTIASTLPPPGYSKTRPHVWALSLPTGAVHLFQVGTPEIAKEFMTTANYWSARLSKEPLSGSVSNIEYGWSDTIVNPALIEKRTESFNSPPASIRNTHARHVHSPSNGSIVPRPSYQSSLRSSIDAGFGNPKSRLPGDKVQIAEWHPPTQSMMSSQLLEVDQLRGLQAYVNGVEEELAKHNELKHAIELAYSPRHTNYQRAMANWQRKSDYLLREIVKFSTYIESLTIAQTAKDQFYANKQEVSSAKHNLTASQTGTAILFIHFHQRQPRLLRPSSLFNRARRPLSLWSAHPYHPGMTPAFLRFWWDVVLVGHA